MHAESRAGSRAPFDTVITQSSDAQSPFVTAHQSTACRSRPRAGALLSRQVTAARGKPSPCTGTSTQTVCCYGPSEAAPPFPSSAHGLLGIYHTKWAKEGRTAVFSQPPLALQHVGHLQPAWLDGVLQVLCSCSCPLEHRQPPAAPQGSFAFMLKAYFALFKATN